MHYEYLQDSDGGGFDSQDSSYKPSQGGEGDSQQSILSGLCPTLKNNTH